MEASPGLRGGYDDRYITQYIITGIGRLQHMNAIPPEQNGALMSIAGKAIEYLDDELTEDFRNLKKNKTDLKINNITAIQIQYLYMRSFFNNQDF
jgi:hypothetical protein